MNWSEDIISKKYASAFLNLYIKDLHVNEMESLEILEAFLHKNKYFYISLTIPSINLKTKKIALEKITQNFQFKKPILLLMNTLLLEGRISLLDKVLKFIRLEYEKKTNLVFFKVLTSHSLTISEKKIIVKLIQKLNNSTIRTNFEVDENLIVGIRIEGSSFLWERSIKKELMKVSHTISITKVEA